MARVLLIGESWFVYSVHQKGFDSFHTSEYEEGGAEFVAALEAAGHEVTRIPAHLIERDFPWSVRDLAAATDVVIISDVGANSFQLSRATFNHSQIEPDRLQIIRDFVEDGGGLLMVGGYMTFSGIDAKARWGHGPLADILPVEILDRDDRVEIPAGISPRIIADHPIVTGLDATWPALLGLNEVAARDSSQTLAVAGDYPVLVISEADAPRTAAFTSDLAPHWATPDFVAWDGYQPLFDRTVRWLAGEDLADG